MIEGLLLGLLCSGHVLLEGPPGLAKTLACRSLADALHGEFKRIQFTPDLLPSDIVGTRIFDQRESAFTTVRGPIFANVVLADEINRAPAKVQSALLEAMQERQVTIGPQTHPLPDPFIVMATMNPLDSEGTYALPVAQMDRFLLKVDVGYPSRTTSSRFSNASRLPMHRSLHRSRRSTTCERGARKPTPCTSTTRSNATSSNWSSSRAKRSIPPSITARARARRSRSPIWRARRPYSSSATTRFRTTFAASRRLRCAIASDSTSA